MIAFNGETMTIVVHSGKVNEGVTDLLQANEAVLLAARSEKKPNDTTLFTDRRIIVSDGKDLLNMKQSITVVPYRSIQAFSYEIGSGIGLVPEIQLDLMLVSGKTVGFKIKGTSDIRKITDAINRLIL